MNTFKDLFEKNLLKQPKPLGFLLKEEGIKKVQEHNEDFVAIMKEKAMEFARENGTVSADDMRPVALALGLKPKHPNAWGAVFNDKRFTLYSYKQSRVTSRHHGLIRVWRLSDDV